MQRSLVIVPDRVVKQVEHLEGQLAAGYQKRPAAGYPAVVRNIVTNRRQAIVAGLDDIDGNVNGRVEHLDDVPLDGDGVGDVDDVAEHVGQAAGDGGLSVSRRPVEQDGAAGVQARPALFDESVVEGQRANRFANAI